MNQHVEASMKRQHFQYSKVYFALSFFAIWPSFVDMGRAPCCDKANVKRGPWSPEEDEILKSYIENHGTGGNWISLPSKAGLRRCGKSCRLRWLNYLRPDIKHGKFTEDEDRVIFSLYNDIGSRWSIIAAKLQGRTDNDVKNHWNTKLKKLLIMKEHNACSEVTSNADQHESYSFTDFPNVKTETHQESMPNMTNLFQGFSGYGSSLSFYHHEPVGYMVPTGVHAPRYASKTTVSPSSVDSDRSSSINAGNFQWVNGRGNDAEENEFLIDMLNYGEGVDTGCHLFQNSIEIGDQKSGGSVAVASFPSMSSDYMYEFKAEGCVKSGLIDQYRSARNSS